MNISSKIGWKFDNSYILLPEIFYSKQIPEKSPSPQLILFNEKLAEDLNLNFTGLTNEYLSQIFSGNILPERADPIAQAYAGHQFGNFNMLGDGRALLIGEHLSRDETRWDIQLKGSGKTIYSRGGDGKAALGPMLREYIISEAMFALGIPTSRSLAVVTTGELINRETPQKGAILTRISSSHIRVGTFEFLNFYKNIDFLKALVHYTINRHFPDLKLIKDPGEQSLSLLNAIIEKQVDLIVNWLRVGFIHGVMNTDNMSIVGETIDYGPCAFMNEYDPSTVFSSIDHGGRYCFKNQSSIGQWNLARLAEALLPLIDKDLNVAISKATTVLSNYSHLFQNKWLTMMRNKIGLLSEEMGDLNLINALLQLMHKNNLDYTNTFRNLSETLHHQNLSFKDSDFSQWLVRWKMRLSHQNTLPIDSLHVMKLNNPAFIPRNHLVEEALMHSLNDDPSKTNQLLSVLSRPYEENLNYNEFQQLPKKTHAPYKTFCGT